MQYDTHTDLPPLPVLQAIDEEEEDDLFDEPGFESIPAQYKPGTKLCFDLMHISAQDITEHLDETTLHNLLISSLTPKGWTLHQRKDAHIIDTPLKIAKDLPINGFTIGPFDAITIPTTDGQHRQRQAIFRCSETIWGSYCDQGDFIEVGEI